MRVLLLSWHFPPRSTGGVAAHVAGLSDALARRGHDVVVLTAGSAAERRSPGGGRVVRVPVDLPYLTTTDRIARVAAANHAIVRAALALVDDDGERWAPDVVHAHDWRVGWVGDTVAGWWRVPLIVTLHGVERIRHGGQLPRGTSTDIDSVEWWLAYRADHVIASTQLMVDQLLTAFELSPERITTIANGIDPTLWSPPAGDADRDREFGLVATWGHVEYQKGFQVLARAVQLLRGTVPELHAVIAGRGSYLPELQAQIDVEGVSDIVELPGYLEDRSLRALAHRASCIVVPSLYEPFGIVALEALASGAPVIAARTGGLAELIDGTNAGLAFEPGNPEDLAARIAGVLGDPELADRLRHNAARLVRERHSWATVAEATATVYTNAADRP